jgi:hypothetical protein
MCGFRASPGHCEPFSGFRLYQSISSQVYYVGGTDLTFNNQSQGASQYQWDFGNGDMSTDFEPDYSYGSPGLYKITLVSTNAYGCSDTSTSVLDVRLPEDLYVPNAFTPNGDAINDYFSIAERNINRPESVYLQPMGVSRSINQTR